MFAGVGGLYGDNRDRLALPSRHAYTIWGGGLHFVVKPAQRIVANLEYAHGVEDNHGFYLKFGYGW